MTEIDKNYYLSSMEQFMEEVRAYAEQYGVAPSTVIQRVGVGGGGTWAKWESGTGSPTLRTVDRLRKYMADNPPPDDTPCDPHTEDAA
ncbi:helix-turn-helix domain-containing protein [Pseudophaeobacter sp. C1-32P7]